LSLIAFCFLPRNSYRRRLMQFFHGNIEYCDFSLKNLLLDNTHLMSFRKNVFLFISYYKKVPLKNIDLGHNPSLYVDASTCISYCSASLLNNNAVSSSKVFVVKEQDMRERYISVKMNIEILDHCIGASYMLEPILPLCYCGITFYYTWDPSRINYKYNKKVYIFFQSRFNTSFFFTCDGL